MNRQAPQFRNSEGELRTYRCRYDEILVGDGIGECCYNPADAGNGLALCFDHARVIGYNVGLDKVSRAERRVRDRRANEREYLRDEVARLRRELDKAMNTESQDKKRRDQEEGHIYFLRVGGYYKIGWTTDLERRMRSYHPDTQLLATHPGTRKDERRLHKKFAHLRTHGREWYPLAPQITEHVQAVIHEHGQPDQVHFSARPVEIPRPHADKPMITPRRWTGKRGA